MSILLKIRNWILGTQVPQQSDFSAASDQIKAGRNYAIGIMTDLNPHALCSLEGNRLIAIEDVEVGDGTSWFRLEYQSDMNGQNAMAWCRYTPYSPQAFSVHQSHIYADGRLCLGTASYDLKAVVLRARYWCLGFCYLRQHGRFPTP